MLSENEDIDMPYPSSTAPTSKDEYSGAASSILCTNQWNMRSFTIDFANQTPTQLLEQIAVKQNIPSSALRLTQDGHTESIEVTPQAVIRVDLKNPLQGGKGGFGSLLRSMKPKTKGDQNFEACRDLSGRRLRTVQQERVLAE